MTRTESTTRRRAPGKGDAREALLLTTLERLLGQKFFAAISIDDLAAGAGISRSSFYFYFASKEAVLTALLEDVTGSLAREYADWYDGSTPPGPALRRSLTHTVRLWASRGPLLQQIYLAPDVPDAVLDFRRASMRRFVDRTAARIERDRAAGDAPPGPPSAALLGMALFHMTNGTLGELFGGGGGSGGGGGGGGVVEGVVEDLHRSHLRLLYGTVPPGHATETPAARPGTSSPPTPPGW